MFHVKHCISNYIIIHNLSKIYRLYTYIVKKYIFSLKLLSYIIDFIYILKKYQLDNVSRETSSILIKFNL